jgi:hypothetical protein
MTGARGAERLASARAPISVVPLCPLQIPSTSDKCLTGRHRWWRLPRSPRWVVVSAGVRLEVASVARNAGAKPGDLLVESDQKQARPKPPILRRFPTHRCAIVPISMGRYQPVGCQRGAKRASKQKADGTKPTAIHVASPLACGGACQEDRTPEPPCANAQSAYVALRGS